MSDITVKVDLISALDHLSYEDLQILQDDISRRLRDWDEFCIWSRQQTGNISFLAVSFAKNQLKHRFELGEEIINKDPWQAARYEEFLKFLNDSV